MKLKKAELWQFLKFMFCSQAAWLCDLAVFTILYQVSGVHEVLSKAASYTVGAVVSYLLNRKFTFIKSRGKNTLVKFIIVNLAAQTMSLTSMYVFSSLLNMEVWLVYFISIAFSFSTNYLGNKFWAFREKRKEERDACARA